MNKYHIYPSHIYHPPDGLRVRPLPPFLSLGSLQQREDKMIQTEHDYSSATQQQPIAAKDSPPFHRLKIESRSRSKTSLSSHDADSIVRAVSK